MHIVGCFWFYIVSIEKVWIPTIDFIWAGQRRIYQFWDDTQSDILYRYAVSYYCAVLALGGNEMGPRSHLEIVVIICLLIGLAILNANIFGEMTVLAAMSNVKNTKFNEQVDQANTAMKNISLKNVTARSIRNYLEQTQGTNHEQQELRQFI